MFRVPYYARNTYDFYKDSFYSNWVEENSPLTQSMIDKN
jgi:hypothetical protein